MKPSADGLWWRGTGHQRHSNKPWNPHFNPKIEASGVFSHLVIIIPFISVKSVLCLSSDLWFASLFYFVLSFISFPDCRSLGSAATLDVLSYQTVVTSPWRLNEGWTLGHVLSLMKWKQKIETDKHVC